MILTVYVKTGIAQNALFTDHGFIPKANISATLGYAAEFQSAFHLNGEVFIATSDGVWKHTISTKTWMASGLQGKKVSCLVKHPTDTDKIFAATRVGPLGGGNKVALYISDDAGASWQESDTSLHETISCIEFNPSNASYMYANVEGSDIIMSSDEGRTWTKPLGLLGYTCYILFLPNNDSMIFQGSESPLDCAWLGSYKLKKDKSVDFGSFKIVVDGQCGTGPWENRRPTNLSAYSHTGNTIYVGQEGALSKVDPSEVNQTRFIYVSEGQKDKPYSYIYGVWVDVKDSGHIVFGGALNGDNSGLMQLYETYDGGGRVFKYEQIFDVSAPHICEIVDLGNNKLGIIINDNDSNKVKLVIMEPESLNVNEDLIPAGLTIYPNPTRDQVYFKYPENLHMGKMNVEVYSSYGNLLIQYKGNAPLSSISTKLLSTGIYYLRISIDDAIFIKRLMVDR